jgi:thiol-disulfide isomerase/thioredoxin
METSILDDLILKNRTDVRNKGLQLQIPDSTSNNGIKQFEDFSSILKKKNAKYTYKNNLVGKNGNAFYLKTSAQDSVNLSSFKGKYLYIDVWATWCKPCKVEYPLLKTLENKLSSSNSVDVISISMDREFDKWKSYVEKNNMKGHHFHTKHDSEFVKYYDIGALPRFILIDPKGQIVSADAIRPSNPDILDYLKSFTNPSTE